MDVSLQRSSWKGAHFRVELANRRPKQFPFKRTLSFAAVGGGLAGRLLAPGGPPGGGGGGGGPEPPNPGIGGGGGGGGGGGAGMLRIVFSSHRILYISLPFFRSHKSEARLTIGIMGIQGAVE